MCYQHYTHEYHSCLGSFQHVCYLLHVGVECGVALGLAYRLSCASYLRGETTVNAICKHFLVGSYQIYSLMSLGSAYKLLVQHRTLHFQRCSCYLTITHLLAVLSARRTPNPLNMQDVNV